MWWGEVRMQWGMARYIAQSRDECDEVRRVCGEVRWECNIEVRRELTMAYEDKDINAQSGVECGEVWGKNSMRERELTMAFDF